MEAAECYRHSSRKVTSKQYNMTQQTDILAIQQQRFRVSEVVALESVMTANNRTAVSAGEQSKCNACENVNQNTETCYRKYSLTPIFVSGTQRLSGSKSVIQ